MSEPVLAVDDLAIDYKIGPDWKAAVRDISFTIDRGESYGLVGESGCGKTTVAMAVMHYLPRNGRVSGGSIRLVGKEVNKVSRSDLRDLRVKQVSMVYQDPSSALNPSIRVGRQVADVFDLMGVPGREHDRKVIEILDKVQIADPERVVRRYPHQLSGGMLQRIVVAMAIASRPSLLVLDEPTTALDATVEAEVLDLVSDLREEIGTSVLFISHSLAVVRKMCDRTGVLYAGRMMAEGPTEGVFNDPRHPYTVGLLRCLPSSEKDQADDTTLDTIPGFLPPLGAEITGCVYAPRCGNVEDICREIEPALNELSGGRVSRCHFPDRAPDLPRFVTEKATARQHSSETLVEITKASKTFIQDGQPVYALSNIDLQIRVGETVGLVGESGSGKSTLAKVLLGIHAPDDGTVITLSGEELAGHLEGRGQDAIAALQMIFQNPDSALNRRHTVRRIIGRAVRLLWREGRKQGDDRTRDLLSEVRMGSQHFDAKPRQLSGGLKQRVAIARAFAGSPALVVCDEPTSALDVSVQAAIINLLSELRAVENVAYLFISHDLNLVRYIADRVAVMYLGRLMEVGPSKRIFAGPHHPYTEALLSASPELDEDTRIRLEGEIPAASNPPSGCVFQTRCPRKLGEICETVEPDLVEAEPGYFKRCHIPVEDLRRMQTAEPVTPVGHTADDDASQHPVTD
ncbi:MAG TPA: ABC transporter ATP-binding protein [Acidimicrobiia bacterium]|nr:ABC transporter ATP-binding protein [Acidimicrobiia bacterium]